MKILDKTMIEITYEIIKEKKEVSFDDLWSQLSEKFSLNEKEKKDKKSDFYCQLTLDGRFKFANGVWKL